MTKPPSENLGFVPISSGVSSAGKPYGGELVHGKFKPYAVGDFRREVDPTGKIVEHRVRKSTYVHEKLHSLNGPQKLADELFDAAEKFRHDFERAQLRKLCPPRSIQGAERAADIPRPLVRIPRLILPGLARRLPRFDSFLQPAPTTGNRGPTKSVPPKTALRRTAQLAYDLGYSGAPIAFCWPSQGSTLAYLRDGATADTSAAALRTFLTDLFEKSGATIIHLIAHSMGNRVLARAVETMAEGSTAGPHFREIALLAPDVDAELLRQMASAIRRRADRVTLYSSSHDEALRLSSKLAGKPRAGQKVQLISGIESIDASPAKTSILDFSHSYFGDSSSVLGDLFRLIQGDPPDARFGLERVASAQGVYWRFKHFAR